MKNRYFQIIAVTALVLAAVFLIAGRLIPRDLESLMPKDFQPESGHVSDFFGTGSGRYLTDGELQSLWSLLNDLEYRYNGRVSGGVMKGQLYHLSFFQLQESPEHVYFFVTKALGVVYLNDKEYEMIGDTAPLLCFLDNLQ